MKIEPIQSPYEFFSLEANATEKDFKEKYISMVREFSPEKDPDMFMKIRNAYKLITKPDTNTYYSLFFNNVALPQSNNENDEDIPATELLKKYFETPFNSDFELKNTFAPLQFNIK